MSEMKVGDIGVLQNFIYCTEQNGAIATIVEALEKRNNYCTTTGELFKNEWTYGVKSSVMDMQGRTLLLIPKNNIRPISSPDAEQETEKKEELVE